MTYDSAVNGQLQAEGARRLSHGEASPHGETEAAGAEADAGTGTGAYGGAQAEGPVVIVPRGSARSPGAT